MVTFEISSYRIESSEFGKKYVLYTLLVGQQNTQDPETSKPSILEKRYTDFLDLHNCLKREVPDLMTGINFPKKVVMGNFDAELILSRSDGFVSFLSHITNDARLREADCTIDFFRNYGLSEAKKCVQENRYDRALQYFENNFRLLNKIYTDRSRVVLIALCRMVACGAGGVGGDPANSCALAGPVEKWASLALRRFDAVSDADLLALYVPLLQACISIWKVLGKDYQPMEDDLDSMRRRGMKVDGCPDLMNAIDQLETAYLVTP